MPPIQVYQLLINIYIPHHHPQLYLLLHYPFFHSPLSFLYLVDDPTLRRLKELAIEHNTSIHIHLHETQKEIEDEVKSSGVRPIERLNKLGLLDDRLISVHMTHLTDEEITLLAKKGVHVVHCPESNLKLGSGICPVSKLLAAGANVCLGTGNALHRERCRYIHNSPLRSVLSCPVLSSYLWILECLLLFI